MEIKKSTIQKVDFFIRGKAIFSFFPKCKFILVELGVFHSIRRDLKDWENGILCKLMKTSIINVCKDMLK